MKDKLIDFLNRLEKHAIKNCYLCAVKEDYDGRKFTITIPTNSTRVILAQLYYGAIQISISKYKDREDEFVMFEDNGCTDFYDIKNRILNLKHNIVEAILETSQMYNASDNFDNALNDVMSEL